VAQLDKVTNKKVSKMATEILAAAGNAEGQQSTVVSITEESTFVVHGTFGTFGPAIHAKTRLTGSTADYEEIGEIDVREAGPVTLRLVGCDVIFFIKNYVSGMAVSIESA
jgi:hypothetical protein